MLMSKRLSHSMNSRLHPSMLLDLCSYLPISAFFGIGSSFAFQKGEMNQPLKDPIKDQKKKLRSNLLRSILSSHSLFLGFILLVLVSSALFQPVVHEDIAMDRSPEPFMREKPTPSHENSSSSNNNNNERNSKDHDSTLFIPELTFGTFQQQPGITSPGSLGIDGTTSLGGVDQLGTTMHSAGSSLIQPQKTKKRTQTQIIPHPSIPDVATPPTHLKQQQQKK